MAKTLKRESCDLCGSKDNLCTFKYKNGNEYQKCMTPGCQNANTVRSVVAEYNEQNEEQTWVRGADDKSLLPLLKQKNAYRGISPTVCNALGIRESEDDETFVAQYIHNNLDGSTDIKYRWPPKVDPETGKIKKRFSWAEPQGKTTTLFALDKCTDFTKPLIITEGNEDAASFWEIGYQACSLLSGSDIEASLRHSSDKINKFPAIILATDNDVVGESAKKILVNMFQNKQLFEVDFSTYKDANECLIADKELLKQKLENAKELLPNGLILGNQLDYELLRTEVVRAIPLPWPGLNDALQGLEYGCFYLLLAGTGVGKSTLLRELVYWYRKNLPELKIANFFFEENEKITPKAYMALDLNIPLGKFRQVISEIPEKDYVKSTKLIDSENLMFINRNFAKDVNSLLSSIEYLVTVKKFDLIVIDHISYIIGRTGLSKNGERRDIDEFVYRMQDLVQRLGCIVLAVSHINESDSTKRWDQGEIPHIYSGRGSKALAQVPDGIIGVARDMTNEYEKSVLGIYNLKNRWHAQTGKTDELIYIEKTGRLVIK